MIVFPVVMLFFYACIHAAMVYHAQSVVSAAAQDGLYWAQLEDGTEADGLAAATQTLNIANGLSNKTITVTQTDDEVTVTVTADVETVAIEAFHSVSVTVSGPRDRFYYEEERR